MFVPYFQKVFTDILKIYKLPKIYIYKRHARAQRALLTLSLKKEGSFKCSAKRVLFQCIRCCPYSLQ